MDIFIMLLVCLALASCSSKRQDWDTGASRQNASEQESKNQQQDILRNQFPGSRF